MSTPTPAHTLLDGIPGPVDGLKDAGSYELLKTAYNEQSRLLSITTALSQTSEKQDILRVIYEHIQPLFPHDAAGLLVIDEDNDVVYEVQYGTVFPDVLQNKLRDTNKTGPWKLSSSHPQSWWMSKRTDPVIRSLYDEYSLIKGGYLAAEQFEAGIEFGLKQFIGGLLYANGKKIGALFFSSKKEHFFTARHYGLFNSISQQIAIALANIIANEAILKKEQEKEGLVKVIEAISKVSSKDKLLNIIFSHIQPLFPFDATGLYVINEEKDQIYEIASGSVFDTKAVTGLPEQAGIFNSSYSTSNPKSWWVSDSSIIINDIETEAGYAKGYLGEEQFQLAVTYGLKHMIGGPLLFNGKKIGALCFNSTKEHFYTNEDAGKFKIISEQLAVAVGKILNTEQILAREKEKSDLLSISNEINCIKDLDGIISWLQNKMRELTGADYAMVTLVNPKKNKAYYVLSEATLDWQIKGTGSARKGIIDSGIPLRGSFFEYLESTPDGTVYRLADVPGHIQHIPFEFCERLGIKESFPLKLIDKEKTIGHLCIHSTETGRFQTIDISLLKNIVNQLSIALVNILNTEELLEREKQKDLEISINNAVLIHESFADVMGEISSSLNKAVGCDICYIRVLTDSFDPRPFHFFCERTINGFVVRPVDAKVVDTGITPRQAGNNAEEFLTTMTAPTILSGMQLEELTHRYQYLQVFTQKIGIRSFIFLPLQLKYNCIAYLIIGSRTAYAYIENDLDLVVSIKTQLSLTLDNRLAFHQIQHLKELLETENLYLQEELHENYNFNEIIGSSQALRDVFRQASMVAGTDSTVLLVGETGTGKELVARAIHNLSDRKDKVMVKVNCACLPVQLIESELFGHEKGAFTGAIERRIGKFELANGGTIFLDEIGELPLELQAKLLRVIQEREFERLGGKSTFKTDIRIIAATNRDLKLETEQKRFRSDLYYRINVFPILLPPLRERKEDIPALAMHFAQKFSLKMRKHISAIHNDALQEMMLHDWPGNVRELEHVIEHSVISCSSPKLVLSKPLLSKPQPAAKDSEAFQIKTLQETEREHILQMLQYCKWKVRGAGGAAQLLNINPNTLESRMVKLGIKKQHVFG